MNVSVLIYSCDAYEDVWEPFFTLFYKYWDCPYDVYLATETKLCLIEGVITLKNSNEFWTRRIQACLEQIPTDYVIGMCEDMFLRKPVKQDEIVRALNFMILNSKVVNVNFEKDYNNAVGGKLKGFGLIPKINAYQKSCQPTLWRKDELLKTLSVDKSPWEWEMSGSDLSYDYYRYIGDKEGLVFDYGYWDLKWFGIYKGKWVKRDVVELFKKENIYVDFSKRGFV